MVGTFERWENDRGQSGESLAFRANDTDRYPFSFGKAKAKKLIDAYDANPEGTIALIRAVADGTAQVGDSTAPAKPKRATKAKKAAEAPAAEAA